MTLDDAGFITKIKALQDEMRDAVDYEASKEQYATKLMQAIKAYLMSGTVTITGTSSVGPITGTGIIS
jgi:hypothetical protein